MIDPVAEAERQAIIKAYRLGDGGSDPAIDRVTALAADLFQVPIALVTVLRSDRQLFCGATGLEGGTDRQSAFCNLTVAQGEIMVVEDATLDERFRDNTMVTGNPEIRFYAGAPIFLAGGVAVGSLCLIDRQPRTLGAIGRRRLEHLAGTVADILEFRVGALLTAEREREIARQSTRLQTTIDAIGQGIAYFDADLRLTVWNDKFFQYHDLDPAFAEIGTRAETLLTESVRAGVFDNDRSEAMLAQVLAGVRERDRSHMVLQTASGRVIDTLRMKLDEGGSVVMARDITSEREGQRAKDQFVSTVSHELRTPITSIRGALTLLDRATDDELNARARQMLDMAQANAARLSTLIDDILDVERLDSGSITFIMVALDLRRVVREAVAQTSPGIEADGVRLVMEDAAEQLYIQGDPGRLTQVLANLLSNAAKFAPPGSAITVTVNRKGGRAKVSVEDRGPGVPRDFIPHLFERFTQAAQQGEPSVGTGLGLAISKAIVERHGGEIGYTPGDPGACFWFTLPLVRAAL